MIERTVSAVATVRAQLASEQARRRVPAYRRFLEERGLSGRIPFARLPETDKDNYVRRFSVEARCLDGRLPARGVVIDESSGTSGEPSNWVRGAKERRAGRRVLQRAIRREFGREPLFVVNAFALGPWATGMNVSMSTVDIAILKSVGPDQAKIENTLRLFGPRYRYLLCGYPPFLKEVVDRADLDWSQLDCAAVVGGEGMSEALRDHLAMAFRRVYSSFGASDLEINIAAENDSTIALRRLLAERPELGTALGLPDHGTLPMVFQFNPLDHLVETNEAGELVFTVCRTAMASPKIRYNLRDLGCVVWPSELDRALGGIEAGQLPSPGLRAPFLFHYGRSDATVAFYGANIAPAEVQAAVLSVAALAERVNSFAMLVWEDGQANKRLTFALELREGVEAPATEGLSGAVLARLAAGNQDYREASRFIPPAFEPELEFYRHGTGPFAGHDPRLKRRYIQEG
jgi:phenylacetate-CoA ligase